jgi:hypothetical protein
MKPASRTRFLTVPELKAAVTPNFFDDDAYRYQFSQQMLGLEVDYGKNDSHFKLYQRVSAPIRDLMIKDRRLASPDHYKFYFALAGPSYALSQDNFDTIWAASANSADKTTEVLLAWHVGAPAGSLSKTDVLLERVKSFDPELLNSIKRQNLLIAFSSMMDQAYHQCPFDLHWVNSIWDRAERLVPVLLSELNARERKAILTKMFSNGASIGWLTSLFRHDTFAQGRYGDQKRPESEWLFSSKEMNCIAELMVKRYQSMDVEEVLSSPSPISLLFAWRQGGDEEGPWKLFAREINSDETLIRVLERLASTMTSSDRGSFDVLKRNNVAPFLDYDEAQQRVKKLASTSSDDALAIRARKLASVFEDGLEY